MDAPLWTHWPKLIVWVAEEATLLVLGLVLDDPFEETYWDPTITDCRQQDWNCHFKRKPSWVAGSCCCILRWVIEGPCMLLSSTHRLLALPPPLCAPHARSRRHCGADAQHRLHRDLLPALGVWLAACATRLAVRPT